MGRRSMNQPRNLSEIDCFLLDMDGTLYLGDAPIEGTLPFLAALKERGKRALFLTNNSSKNAELYQAKLSAMGIETSEEDILTSTKAAVVMLRQLQPDARLYVLGNEHMRQELLQNGVIIDESNPNALLLGYDDTLRYDRLNVFCRYIQQGLPYYATHGDINCPTEWGYAPDAGAFMALIERSTKRLPDGIAGKPERGLLDLAMEITGLPLERMAVCGDRLYTDIAFGNLHGLTSVLVLSGESKRADISKSAYTPDVVVDRLYDLVEMMG